jgi:hypothetical protein
MLIGLTSCCVFGVVKITAQQDKSTVKVYEIVGSTLKYESSTAESRFITALRQTGAYHTIESAGKPKIKKT